MARLQMNSQKLLKEFKKALMLEIENSRERFENEIKLRMRQSHPTESITQMALREMQSSVEEVTGLIKLYVDGNASTLMNNYGSGSLMDVVGNALIDEYIATQNDGSKMWNHYRSKSDTTIKGRDRGEYTDIFGNSDRWSPGTYANKNIEGVSYTDKYGIQVKIEPWEPTHAIEEGIKWYVKDIDTMVSNAINRIDFSECLIYK